MSKEATGSTKSTRLESGEASNVVTEKQNSATPEINPAEKSLSSDTKDKGSITRSVTLGSEDTWSTSDVSSEAEASFAFTDALRSVLTEHEKARKNNREISRPVVPHRGKRVSSSGHCITIFAPKNNKQKIIKFDACVPIFHLNESVKKGLLATMKRYRPA